MKTRACKVGDVLAEAEVPCGAQYTVTVFDPKPHPDSGVTDDKSVTVLLAVIIPHRHDVSSGLIPTALRDEKVSVLGEVLRHNWGEGEVVAGRFRTRKYAGPAIAKLVADASEDGHEAVTKVQAISDAHEASRTAQETARASAYAAWQVQDA